MKRIDGRDGCGELFVQRRGRLQLGHVRADGDAKIEVRGDGLAPLAHRRLRDGALVPGFEQGDFEEVEIRLFAYASMVPRRSLAPM